MDRTVANILDQLRRDGLYDSTVILFFGDNGRIEPRGIHWCYDTGLHVPLMRQLMAEGKLSGPPAQLMEPTVAPEQLFDTIADPHEIQYLADSKEPGHQQALIRLRAALAAWIEETQDRGKFPAPPAVVAPFEKEMHVWCGTPAWYRPKPIPTPDCDCSPAVVLVFMIP